jgi:hypothetical protein
MQEQRIRFRDVKPYFVPNSFDDLHGPYSGKIRLSHSVRWTPGDRVADLGTIGGRRMAYQALLAEGQVSDQVANINPRRLIETWPLLNLDPRVRELWESRFPQLRRV